MIEYLFFCQKSDDFKLFDNGLIANDTIYSDRMFELDSKKYNLLCEKYFGNQGQAWSGRKTTDIESFLREYLDNNSLVLCQIYQYVNKSNGYPYWRFDIKK